MFNRISELSKEALQGSAPAAELDTGPLESLVDDGESVQYVLASADGIEHTTDGRTTTIEPSGDHASYAVVTEQQVYFLLGDDPTTAEVTVELGAVKRTELNDGLLSTALVVRTDDESISFKPDATEQATAAETYIDRIGSCWRDLETALAGAREALDGLKDAIENGNETDQLRQRARSRISKAHHCATHEDDAPTGKMRARIEPIETELERLCTAAETEQIERLLDEAEQAYDAAAYETAFEVLLDARGTITGAYEVIDDGDALDRLDAFERTHDDLATAFLDRAEERCHDALTADEPSDAVAAWESALERYRAALAAGWDGAGGVSADALRFQLAWVVQHLVDALEADAVRLEESGDEGDDDDETAEDYQAALDRLQRAKTLATEHPHAAGDAFDDRIDRLEEKAERAQWQWGAAD